MKKLAAKYLIHLSADAANGTHISDVVDCVVTMSSKMDIDIELKFNYCLITVHPDDNVDDVIKKWYQKFLTMTNNKA